MLRNYWGEVDLGFIAASIVGFLFWLQQNFETNTTLKKNVPFVLEQKVIQPSQETRGYK
jgi:hypothetical protein